jgi:hypothetical protein
MRQSNLQDFVEDCQGLIDILDFYAGRGFKHLRREREILEVLIDEVRETGEVTKRHRCKLDSISRLLDDLLDY